MLEERRLTVEHAASARGVSRQPYDAELRSLVASTRARFNGALACLSRHTVGERGHEILATDAVDRLALSPLPDLIGWAGQRLSSELNSGVRLSAHGPLMRMMFAVDQSDVLLMLVQRRDDTSWAEHETEAVRTYHADLDRYLKLWWQHRRLHRRCQGLQATLDLHDIGALVLDGEGHLLFANRPGTALLDAKDGLRLFGSSVTATRVEDAIRLQAALLHAVGQHDDIRRNDWQTPVTLIHRKNSARPLIAAAMRIAGPAAEPGDPVAVIYLIDPDRTTQGMIEPACRVYGLTGAEVRLTAMLLRGLTLADAARHLRIKPLTAKAYLKQIFAKMGVHRQADLVRVLFGSMLRTSEPLDVTIL